MKPILPLICLLLVSFLGTAQQRMSISTGCAFSTNVQNINPYLFDSDPQAEQIVGEICRALGIQQSFILKSSDVENALACERDGQRYILYNPNFLKDFQSDARTKWAAYGVLAHEIGHHINFHHFEQENMARRKEYELESDRFAGSVLRLLGASRDQAKAAVANLLNKTETNTHPPAGARLVSVVNGWNDQDTRIKDMITTGETDFGAQGGGGIPIVLDRDRDGVPDTEDACPEIPGDMLLKGCPDADGDGITDEDDKCPYQKGEARWKGCPDTDGDGIPDNEDQCPYVRGELVHKGCPPPDRDRDNIPDATDRCPDAAGTIRFRGCPDTDGDGIPDIDDKCPNEKGDPNYGGCLNPPGQGSAVANNTALENLIKNRKSGLSMKAVPGGTFTMGSPSTESGRDDDECQHSVAVASFKIGYYEVTQADWYEVMGIRPSNFKDCNDCPVEQVSWEDIQVFLTKLNEKTGLKFRLPTEAEWEFAARGGVESKKYLYAGSNTVDDVAWYGSNSGSKTHSVGTKKANELGLFDLSGNVWEWCQDTYQPYPCDGKTVGKDTVRVLRGGSWNNDYFINIRCAERVNYDPSFRYHFYGFRLAQD